MILGLTGGIASGKSSVSNIFKEIGIKIIDADIIAKEISERKNVKNLIVKKISNQILDFNGNIDRLKLKKIVFQDKDKLNTLNDIIHPLVIKELENIKKFNEGSNEIIVFDIPLLFEAKLEYLCDKILLIYTDFNTQVERIARRDLISKELAQKIILSQMPLKEKMTKANFFIENSSTLESLKNKIIVFLKNLKKEI